MRKVPFDLLYNSQSDKVVNFRRWVALNGILHFVIGWPRLSWLSSFNLFSFYQMAVSKLDDDIKWRPRNKWVCHNMVALHMRRFCCLAILILNFTHYNCGSLHTTHYNQALHMQQQRQFCCLAPLMVRGAESDWRANQTPVCRPTITKTEANHENKQFLFLNVTKNSNNQPKDFGLIPQPHPSKEAKYLLWHLLWTRVQWQRPFCPFSSWPVGYYSKLEQWPAGRINWNNEEAIQIWWKTFTSRWSSITHFNLFWTKAETKFHLFWILYQSYWWWSKICQAFSEMFFLSVAWH